MDIGSIASSMASSGVSTSIGMSVLKSVNNLEASQAALLAASIGLGSGIDASA